MDTLYRTGSLGDQIVLTLPLKNADGTDFEPGDDYALIFTAKRRDTDTDADAVIQCATGAGIEASGSNAVVTINRAATVDLEPCKLVCDIQAQHVVTGEIVRTVAYLILGLRRDITRETTTSVPVITTEDPLPFGASPAAQTYGSADPNGNVTGDYIGQLCKASTAWWQWNGTAWIPRYTDDGEPIAYNATLATYRKLTVSGADGSEIITISAL